MLRRETFGQELSEGQTSVSWLRGTGCQRSPFLPNSEVQRLRPTLLFKQPGGHNRRGKVLGRGLMAAVFMLIAVACSDAMVTASRLVA